MNQFFFRWEDDEYSQNCVISHHFQRQEYSRKKQGLRQIIFALISVKENVFV